uniref:Uncharacterized protein n=1 Tax=Rhizophora mucronata TaxID=61149 RepID=A0A2P2J083_RHIMU
MINIISLNICMAQVKECYLLCILMSFSFAWTLK